MKKHYLLAIFLLIYAFGFSQENFSRVRIYANDADLQEIYNLGVAIDHGKHKANTWFEVDLPESDIQTLQDNGYTCEVLIENVSEFYVARNQQAVNKDGERASCPGSSGSTGFTPVTPANFQLGSMGGYYTYQEFLDELDAMNTQYPNLISAKAPISTDTLTWEGRPLYWVRISDNPETNEGEHEVLYTALHHAREPLSLSQLIYYMWYLLENYGTDPEITFLVDNTEMYFVPMINPDGYVYNETTDPNGGGMHRKNRNPSVGTSNKGVDLNRNYAYNWGTTGVSGNQNNDTYPGSGAFSEPETKLIKVFCETHDFKFAFNNHTYGDELLHPIGWSNTEFAPHHNYFQQYSGHMTLYSGWNNIKSSDLYPASGDSDDWMYIDDIANKDTIFAMTPEIGDDFWPPSSAIEATCKEMLYSNIVLAHLPHVFGVTTDQEPSTLTTTTGFFNYEVERLGLENGDITVSITPLTGIQTVGGSNVHTLNLMEIKEDSISYTLDAGIGFGDEIKYILHTDNGTWVRNDTIIKSFGAGNAVFTDNCDNTTNWIGSWSFTNEDFVSASNSITDSPFSNYGNGAQEDIELSQSFDFTTSTYAYASFYAKWEIENNWDYVEFQISTDGGNNWTPLCGNYTNMGTNDQDFDQPLYDGFQTNWVLEEVDLADYLGNANCKFRFLLVSDGWVNEDGFYFDDFTIYADSDTSSGSGIDELADNDVHVYPNPANELLTVQLDDFNSVQQITVLNELGQPVLEMKPNGNMTKIELDNLAEGVYFVRISGNDNSVVTKRFTILR